jgi:rhodanese-related sulfurtransferase
MCSPCRRSGGAAAALLLDIVEDVANLRDTFSALRAAVKATEQASDGGHAAIG